MSEVKLTEQDMADLKYAVAALYNFSQGTDHEEGIKRWGILAEKLNSIPTNVSGYNDEDYIKRHLDGEFNDANRNQI